MSDNVNTDDPGANTDADAFADDTISADDAVSKQSSDGGKDMSPASGQADGGDGNKGMQNSSSDGQGDAAQALKDSLGFTRTPEEAQQSLKEQLSAASKTSRLKHSIVEKMTEMLKAQGLNVSVDMVKNEKNEEVPNVVLSLKKGYTHEADKFKFSYDDLSSDEKEDFLDAPQKLIDTVVSKAKQAFARAIPAGESKPQVSQEKCEAALEFLSKQKDAGGNIRYPGLDENKELIVSMLDDPSMSNGLKALLSADPEMGMELLNARVSFERTRLLSNAAVAQEAEAEKNKQANADGSAMPASDGTTIEKGDGTDPFEEFTV